MQVVVHRSPHTDGIIRHLPDDIAVTLVEDTGDIPPHLPEADALLAGTWEEDWFDHADRLAWYQSRSAGVDHLPVERMQRHGITVTTASGVHPDPIAEYVYGSILAWERGLFQCRDREKQRAWPTMRPREVSGRTMAIIGVGAIGRAIAERGDAFGLDVTGVDPDHDETLEHIDTWHLPDTLTDAVQDAAYVVLACPLNDATRGMVDATVLDAMPDDALLVNIARGGVVDQDALVTALQADRIGGAVLDVFEEEPLPEDSPLWTIQDCVVTPHMSGATPRYAERLADVFTENLEAFRNGEPMPTEV